MILLFVTNRIDKSSKLLIFPSLLLLILVSDSKINLVSENVVFADIII